VFDFVGMVCLAMEPNAPGGTVERNNVFTSCRKKTLQIADHFRHVNHFLDSEILLQACRLLAPCESGLFLVESQHEIFPFMIDRTSKLCL
jgi:hypothetical protein